MRVFRGTWPAIIILGALIAGCGDDPSGPPLPGDDPPMAVITAPSDLDAFLVYTTVNFTGSATDAQDGTDCCLLAATWSTRGLGVFGTGESASGSAFDVGDDFDGVTWTVTDLDGNTDSETVSFRVFLPVPLLWDVDEERIWTGTGIRGSGFVTLGANPAWSPDGSQIAFQRSDGADDEIWIADADGSNEQRLTDNAFVDDSPAWSPDGLRIAYTSAAAGNEDIYIMTVATLVSTQLTTDPGTDTEADWNGTMIAFQSDRSGSNDVWVVSDDLSTGPTNLTNNPADDKDPHWFPDGSGFVFSTDRDGNHEIYRMDAAGLNLVNLTNNLALDREPEVSPDQSIVVFISDRENLGEAVWLSRIDGSDPLRVDHGSSQSPAGHPRWKP